MAERTQYAPGTFCWTDLTTTDQDAAKQFYGALFGWELEDVPVGNGVVYTMARVGGKDVGAISPQPQMLRDAGAPPTWNSYVSVEDADAVAQRAGELGATVLGPPFDVMQAGRMTVLRAAPTPTS
jgi:predicted enzyme related to lactoylglutathione lyase